MRSMDERGGTGSAGSTADAVRQEGSAVADTAKGEAKDLAHTVREQGEELAHQAKAELRHVADDAREQLREQVSQQSERVTESLRRLGDQVGALADGRPEEAGPLGDYVQSAAAELRHAAGRMEQHGFDGLMEDTKRFARKRPAAFLGIAVIAGFAAGRLLRGGTEARKQHQEEQGTAERTPPSDWPAPSPGDYVPPSGAYTPSSGEYMPPSGGYTPPSNEEGWRR